MPQFHAKAVPPGTAAHQNHSDAYARPHPTGDAAGASTAAGTLDPASTLQGTTSAEVDTGLGKPMGGETSTEKHHDGKAHRKHDADGLVGLGASAPGEANDLRRLQRDD